MDRRKRNVLLLFADLGLEIQSIEVTRKCHYKILARDPATGKTGIFIAAGTPSDRRGQANLRTLIRRHFNKET